MNLSSGAIFGPLSATCIGLPSFGFAPCLEPFVTAFGEIDGLDVLHANVDETTLHFTVFVEANSFAGLHLFPALIATPSGEAGGRGSFASDNRSEEHTSELQSLMRISYAVFCLKKKTNKITKPRESKYYRQRP